jgi:hypothetical protein
VCEIFRVKRSDLEQTIKDGLVKKSPEASLLKVSSGQALSETKKPGNI